MNKLEKKQIPQFAALCVLSAGLFGYFVVKIVTPSPAAAGTRRPPVAAASQAVPTASPSPAKGTGAGPDAAPAEDEAPVPTPGMRDPFVAGLLPGGSAPATASAALPAAPVKPSAPPKPAKAAAVRVASIHEVGPAAPAFPAAPALPLGLKGFPPLRAAPASVTAHAAPARPAAPAAPAPPAWTVTGVLQNETEQVAVLRNGEARRIVRTGDFVDSAYQVVTVTRSAVVLRHGKTLYHLTLGASKAVPGPVAVPGPAPKPARAPQDAALAPTVYAASPMAELAQAVQAALMLAQFQVDACLASFHARTAEMPCVAMRFLGSSATAPGANDARHQDDFDANDSDAADKGGKLLDRHHS